MRGERRVPPRPAGAGDRGAGARDLRDLRRRGVRGRAGVRRDHPGVRGAVVTDESAIAALERLVAEERFGAHLTVVAGEGVGSRAVFGLEEGVVAGGLPPGLEAAVEDASVLIDREMPATLAYGDVEVFIEPIVDRKSTRLNSSHVKIS